MPAAMEGWRSSGGSSKEEQESGGTTGSGAITAGGGGRGNEAGGMPLVAAGSKRQRRPSVRLGEIGDLKVAASKSEALSTVRWISPNFIPKKSASGGFARGAGKLPRTRPLANMTHRGESVQVLGSSPKVGSNDVVVAPPKSATAEVAAGDDVEKEEEEEAEVQEGPPSTSGRGNYGATNLTSPRYGSNKRGKPGKRKRAPSVRTSTIAKTFGVVALSCKAKELQKVGYIGSLAPASASEPAASTADVSVMPIEFAELSGTHADMEEDSGAARGAPGNNKNNSDDDENSEEEHTQNGDTEVLEGDNGNGEDSSGRQEEDEPATSLGVRDNQIISTNGALKAPHDFQLPKEDQRDQCTSRLTDGEKDRKNTLQMREASMNGRRSGARGVRSWLNSLGLEKYNDLFEENEVDNDVLHLLTFEDLKEMGVVAVGARRKMFSAIQELGPATLLAR